MVGGVQSLQHIEPVFVTVVSRLRYLHVSTFMTLRLMRSLWASQTELGAQGYTAMPCLDIVVSGGEFGSQLALPLHCSDGGEAPLVLLGLQLLPQLLKLLQNAFFRYLRVGMSR